MTSNGLCYGGPGLVCEGEAYTVILLPCDPRPGLGVIQFITIGRMKKGVLNCHPKRQKITLSILKKAIVTEQRYEVNFTYVHIYTGKR